MFRFSEVPRSRFLTFLSGIGLVHFSGQKVDLGLYFHLDHPVCQTNKHKKLICRGNSRKSAKTNLLELRLGWASAYLAPLGWALLRFDFALVMQALLDVILVHVGLLRHALAHDTVRAPLKVRPILRGSNSSL